MDAPHTVGRYKKAEEYGCPEEQEHGDNNDLGGIYTKQDNTRRDEHHIHMLRPEHKGGYLIRMTMLMIGQPQPEDLNEIHQEGYEKK